MLQKRLENIFYHDPGEQQKENFKTTSSPTESADVNFFKIAKHSRLIKIKQKIG